MTKKPARYALFLVAPLLALIGYHYLWVAIFWYPGDLSRLYETSREQRHVHLKLVVTDQFGDPAQGFKIDVKIRSISRLLWLFPKWAFHESIYRVETDGAGNASLSPFMLKAMHVEFKEATTDKYMFPNGKQAPYEMSFNNNPRGSLDMKILDRTGQVIDMRVLRHDPPVNLSWYRPEIPGRGPVGRGSGGVVLEAQDEMVFTACIKENKLLEGRQPGDIVITVRKAKEACDFAKKLHYSDCDIKEEGEWSVSFEGLQGTMIKQEGQHQVVTFAPEVGNKKRLTYRLAIKKGWSPSESAESNSSGGDLMKLTLSAPDEDDYVSIGPQENFARRLYFRHESPRWYGLIDFGFSLRYREGRLGINVSGAYNPTGSSNLWYVYAGSIGWL